MKYQKVSSILQGNKTISYNQGQSVALSADGNTVVIGAPPSKTNRCCTAGAWVFTRHDHKWSLQTPTVLQGNKGADSYQGASVALSADGNTLAISAPEDGNYTGGVWIYVRSHHGVWSLQTPFILQAVTEGRAFQGFDIALSASGNTLAVGSPGDDANGFAAGGAWIFTRMMNHWFLQTPVILNGPTLSANSLQGNSVALSEDGNTLAIGAARDSTGGLYAGGAFVFVRNGEKWALQTPALLQAPTTSGCPEQGFSVALSGDGNTLAVGTPFDNTYTTDGGGVWVFVRCADGAWSLQTPDILHVLPSDSLFQGYSVSLSGDGNTLAVGAPFDNTGAFGTGGVWIFTRTETEWTLQTYPIIQGDPTTTLQKQGTSVTLSADATHLVFGAPGSESNVGGAWVFSLF